MQPLIGGSVPIVVAPLIRKLDKIHGLNAAEWQALEKLPATLRHFAPGEDIIREGDKPTMVCMVVDGTAFRYTMVEPQQLPQLRHRAREGRGVGLKAIGSLASFRWDKAERS
jgi:hypothetical protein